MEYGLVVEYNIVKGKGRGFEGVGESLVEYIVWKNIFKKKGKNDIKKK